jgi:hypothetical protein
MSKSDNPFAMTTGDKLVTLIMMGFNPALAFGYFAWCSTMEVLVAQSNNVLLPDPCTNMWAPPNPWTRVM